MALAPKPITLTVGDNPQPSLDPQPFVVVGGIPGTGGPEITPQTAPAVDAAPEDPETVASDLQAVVAALIAAGVFE